jgi:hypothetical protein
MRAFYIVSLCLILISISNVNAQSEPDIDISVLKGSWKIDMSPEDKTDANFANMKISEVSNSGFKGYFYKEGFEIRSGMINTQLGIVYGALISGDGTGEYNTAFYYKDGLLYGTTHSVNRDFLAVWIATKEN